MRLVVSAICKNEEKHVERFLKAVENEVDHLYILDTGSTDNTVELFSNHPKVTIKQINYGKNFDFEIARNDALQMIEQDKETILFSLDLDEIPRPGFGVVVKQAFANPKITRLRYRFNWSLKNGIPQIYFNSEKIWRAGLGYKWKYLLHERIVPVGFEEVWQTVDIVVDHYADNSKPRSSYLPLLKRNYEKYPMDQRSVLYYGRELYFYKQYQEAIPVLHKFLLMDNLWNAEKAYCYRLIGKSYLNLGDKEQAYTKFNKALKVYSNSRDTYMELCHLYYQDKQWGFLLGTALQGLQLNKKPLDYMESPESWGYCLYDYTSIALWNLGMKEQSLIYGLKALEYEKDNERLNNNVTQILESL